MHVVHQLLFSDTLSDSLQRSFVNMRLTHSTRLKLGVVLLNAEELAKKLLSPIALAEYSSKRGKF